MYTNGISRSLYQTQEKKEENALSCKILLWIINVLLFVGVKKFLLSFEQCGLKLLEVDPFAYPSRPHYRYGRMSVPSNVTSTASLSTRASVWLTSMPIVTRTVFLICSVIYILELVFGWINGRVCEQPYLIVFNYQGNNFQNFNQQFGDFTQMLGFMLEFFILHST